MTFSRFLDPKNDVAFKKVFGSEKNKDILIHFINDILGFTDNNEIAEVEFLSTIQDAEIASKKESIVDVLCKDKNGVQYIIEMQVAPSIGFEKRAQYYAAKAYCRQTGRGQGENGKYANLKEIIFIAITNYIVFPNKRYYKSDHIILDKNSYEHDLQDFYFTFIELPKFTKKKVEELENIIEKWCFFFKYAKKTNKEDLQKIIEGDCVIERAYEALDQFNWCEKELIAYEEETKRIWDNQAAEDYKAARSQELETKMKEFKELETRVGKLKELETRVGKLKELETRVEKLKEVETRMEKAEEDKVRAEDAKTRAEDAKTRAEDAKAKAEDAKTRAEDAKTRAEDAKAKAEDAKAKAEDAKAKAEEDKMKAEIKIYETAIKLLKRGINIAEVIELTGLNEEKLSKFI